MFFDDWETHPKEKINKALLWEYNTDSPEWDWSKAKKTVVQRVISLGRPEDYYAMFQLYGGFENVKAIVKTVPELSDKDINWCCVLFGLQKEELWSYNRALSRKKLLDSWKQ